VENTGVLSASAFCSLPFTQLKVDPAGNVNMCCFQRGALGNVFAQPVEEIWSSQTAQEIRAATASGSLHSSCEGWGACPFLVQPRLPKPVPGAGTFPIALELDLPNTHCNIGGTSPTRDTACFMCPRSVPDFVPDEDRSLELAGLLRPLMPSLKELRVQGVAEPFWRGRLFAVLARLGFPDYREQCHFSTYTNGSLLPPKVRARFFDLCPDSLLLFSIDAATQATYQRIRRMDFFDLVVSNLRASVRERSSRQLIAISNNMNLLNIHEAVQMVELADELGVDWVEFNPTHDGGSGRGDLRDVCVGPDNWQEFRIAQEQITERAQELGVQAHFIRQLDLGIGSRSKSLLTS
jgi:radical SAM protein with 4Fe4S-binding SPASM domain